jgi:hypothetical protein
MDRFTMAFEGLASGEMYVRIGAERPESLICKQGHRHTCHLLVLMYLASIVSKHVSERVIRWPWSGKKGQAKVVAR